MLYILLLRFDVRTFLTVVIIVFTMMASHVCAGNSTNSGQLQNDIARPSTMRNSECMTENQYVAVNVDIVAARHKQINAWETLV